MNIFNSLNDFLTNASLFTHFLWSSFCLQDDYLVSKPVKQHLAKYDKQLKKFNVSKALDTALEVSRYMHLHRPQC